MNFKDKIIIILKNRKAIASGIVVGLIFLIIYLISIQHLSLADSGKPSLVFADNIIEKIFSMRAPFMWEPIASLSFLGVQFFVSPLNILLGVLLSILVFLNISVAVFSYQYRKVCSVKPGYSLTGVLPAMFTGFACCAPTFIIALAPALASFTIFFITIQPFLIPASFLIMSIGLWWSVSRIPIEDKNVSALMENGKR